MGDSVLLECCHVCNLPAPAGGIKSSCLFMCSTSSFSLFWQQPARAQLLCLFSAAGDAFSSVLSFTDLVAKFQPFLASRVCLWAVLASRLRQSSIACIGSVDEAYCMHVCYGMEGTGRGFNRACCFSSDRPLLRSSGMRYFTCAQTELSKSFLALAKSFLAPCGCFPLAKVFFPLCWELRPPDK